MRFPPKALALAGALTLLPVAAASAQTQTILTDPVASGGAGQHRSVVEPDNYAFGATIVAAAQVGRVFDGGADRIGWATSTDNGATWTSGILPGLTTAAGGGYNRATDPAVAYDARHGVWLISTLGLLNTSSGPNGAAVLTSRSLDGGQTFGNPVVTAAASRRQDFDKNWISCDN